MAKSKGATKGKKAARGQKRAAASTGNSGVETLDSFIGAPRSETKLSAAAVAISDQGASVLLHPATSAMIARGAKCNKPLILWRRQADGSYLECFLQADCTYSGCIPVSADQVPGEVKNSQN
jgi:hypothetical protein